MTLKIREITEGLDLLVEAVIFAEGEVELESDSSVVSRDYSDGSQRYEITHKLYFPSNKGTGKKRKPDLEIGYSCVVERNESVSDRISEFTNAIGKKGIAVTPGKPAKLRYENDNQAQPLFSREHKLINLPKKFHFYGAKDHLSRMLRVNGEKVLNYVMRRQGEYFRRQEFFFSQSSVVQMFGSFRGNDKRCKELVYAAMAGYAAVSR